jgi:glucosamine--fructose-6-phosphate aminotransferase (isomerizing)
MDEARRLVGAATCARFVALGSSRHAAGYGAEVVGTVAGVPGVVAPAPGWGTSTNRWRAGEVVVAVTQSGHTPALLDAVAEARGAGCPVVAVVNADDSPLHALADVVLPVGAGAERVVAATKSVTAQHVVLRALAGDVDRDAMQAAVAAALRTDVGVAVRGEPPVAVVCGGVAGEWVAGEVALKFAEMLGRFVVGEPLVEFLHGPVAADGAVLALADPADPNLAELVSRRDVAAAAAPPAGDPTVDPIARLVVGQRVVLAWAEALGVDADLDRGLSKVTGTS